MSRPLLLLLLPLLVAGCTEQRTRSPRLQSFKVTLRSDPGSPDGGLLPFDVRATREFVIDVDALDSFGQPLFEHNGRIKISVVPGVVVATDPAETTVLGGSARGIRVTVQKSYGPTNLLVEDASGANPWALGVSERIWIQNPRIRDIQQPLTSRDSSPLAGMEVVIDRGTNIVVHVSNSGFYVVDTHLPAGETNAYHSLFAYNYNRPEGLRRGDRLCRLAGNISEFLGYTELNFPYWDVDLRCPVPDDPGGVCPEADDPEHRPTRCQADEFCVNGTCVGQQCGDRLCAEGSVCMEADGGLACVPNPNIPDPVTNPPLANSEMEKYEGGLVRFTNVIVSHDFVDCDDPATNPGANGNGACEYCRTCNANRDQNGTCPSGGRCCPSPLQCYLPAGECASVCDSVRDASNGCPPGKKCCPPGPDCDLGLGICKGCTAAENAEAACDDACARRTPTSPGGICTNLCDFRAYGQYRIGLTTNGQWNGASLLAVTADTFPAFRPNAPENRGKLLRSLTGTLRNVYAPGAIWILEARDECDVVGDGIPRERKDCDTVK
jgi:hypothetical protein